MELERETIDRILRAAEAAAAEIEGHAQENATKMREQAEREAERIRSEARDSAREHLGTMIQVTARLVEQLGSLGPAATAAAPPAASAAPPAEGAAAAPAGFPTHLESAAPAEAGYPLPTEGVPPAAAVSPAPPIEEPPAPVPEPVAAASIHAVEAQPPEGDLDGARLIALNMALNGQPRAETDRYLAENFHLADRQKLIEEVYAAVEG